MLQTVWIESSSLKFFRYRSVRHEEASETREAETR